MAKIAEDIKKLTDKLESKEITSAEFVTEVQKLELPEVMVNTINSKRNNADIEAYFKDWISNSENWKDVLDVNESLKDFEKKVIEFLMSNYHYSSNIANELIVKHADILTANNEDVKQCATCIEEAEVQDMSEAISPATLKKYKDIHAKLTPEERTKLSNEYDAVELEAQEVMEKLEENGDDEELNKKMTSLRKKALDLYRKMTGGETPDWMDSDESLNESSDIVGTINTDLYIDYEGSLSGTFTLTDVKNNIAHTPYLKKGTELIGGKKSKYALKNGIELPSIKPEFIDSK